MGCGTSNTKSNAAEEPNKKTSQSEDFNNLMGNVVPKQLIIEKDKDSGKKGDLSNGKGQKEDSQQSPRQEDDVREQRKRKEQRGGKKLRGEYGEQEQIVENVEQIQRKIKSNDLQLIVSSLKNHFMFFALSDSDMEYIVQKMFYCEVKNDNYVFKQGDKATSYFILDKGKIEIIIDGQSKKKLGPGTGFGELALLYNAPRSASIKCIGDCGFWAIDRVTFRKSVEDMVMRDFTTNRKFMEQVTFFNFMNPEQKDAIAQGLFTQKFKPGQNIVNEGDQADSFYMIKEGEVSIWKGQKELRKLGKGDSFGEQALFVSSVRAASVKADTEVKVLSLGRDKITQILGDKIQIIVYNNLQRWAYDKSPVLKELTKLQVEKLTQNAQIANYQAGTVLVEKGKPCNKIFIVLEGKLVEGTSRRQVAAQREIFGDEFLPKDKQDKPLKDDIVMEGNGVLSVIPFQLFFKCIGGDLETIIIKNKDGHEKKMAALEDKADYSHIKLDNLLYIKKLGFGQFGTVFLVQNKETKELYALKSVQKAQIIEQNLEKHLIQEKQVLESINFPFIMKFFRTFKDYLSVYFLTEFISGMELFDVIRDIGLLGTTDSQYYVGSMILGMEYLHSKSIIYRDLKPENIMVNAHGHMFIIDLGTAKNLKKNKNAGRTFTIIGTPHYMAPEIIQGKGYSYSVDLWSIGICLYEFMAGGVPFAEDAEDPYQIYEEIMRTDQLKYPGFFKDRKARKLIEQLLSKVPELRLGGSYAALKANPWFDNFDWDKLYSRELPPPYKPPKEKVIQHKEIDQMAGQNRPIINEIKEEQNQFKKKYKKEMAKDPNWDQEF